MEDELKPKGNSPQEPDEEEAAEKVSPLETADEGNSPQEPDEEEAAEEVSPPQEEIEEPREVVMVKLECISRYTLVDPKTEQEIQTFGDVDYGNKENICEVEDKVAKKLLATGNFVKV